MINNLFAYDTISTSRLMKASFDLTKDTFWKKRENKNFVQQSFLSLHLKGEWKLVVMLLIIKRLSPINACQPGYFCLNIILKTRAAIFRRSDRVSFEFKRMLSASFSLPLSFSLFLFLYRIFRRVTRFDSV